ncbi:hypothetical protein, partial [Mesorhizobium sp. LNHC229A00]|uniref:hypothetical protein n=2 Tax=unclassified Mesorhizobium TaxID=325217 RepID=UPI0012EC9DE3
MSLISVLQLGQLIVGSLRILSPCSMVLFGWMVICALLPEESVLGHARLYLARRFRKRTNSELMGFLPPQSQGRRFLNLFFGMIACAGGGNLSLDSIATEVDYLDVYFSKCRDRMQM